MNLAELLAQIEAGLTDLSDEELAQLLADVRAASEDLLNGDPSDEDLELLERAAAGIETITAEEGLRATAEAERAERAQALRDRIAPAASDETEEAEEGAEEEAEAAEGEEVEEPEAAAEPIAAAARPRVSAPRPRRPAAMVPKPRAASIPEYSLVAAANLPDIAAGTPLNTPDLLARAMISAYLSAEGYRGPRVKVPVARIGAQDPADIYGEDRTLRRDAPAENARRLDALVSQQAVRTAVTAAGSLEALTAAGGICAPPEVRYDLPTVGIDDRPVRDDMLVRVGSDRGALSVLPPPVISDLAGAITTWTAANDLNPSAPATKPCLTVTCPDAETTMVDAIVRCLEFGNFRARFFPEQVAAWVALAAVNHARHSEVKLLTSIGVASTQVTTGQNFGAVADLLAELAKGGAIIRSRHRLGADFPLQFGFPFWLLDMLFADMVRQMNGTGTYEEKLGAANESFLRWMRNRNIIPVPFLDGESGQIFGQQGDAPMLGWPSTVVTYLYPAGTHLFLDGGMLDLGIVRDSTLNSTNDYQMFAESFENHLMHGVESWRLTLDLCPSGLTAATSNNDPCTEGS